MKLITFCSFKGGAGKTTALMGLCSAMAAQGRTIALFEADENRPLSRWRDNAVRRQTWDPKCTVFVADELPLLEAAYDEATSKGFDFALVDTQGGSSELNNTLIASSNFLILPSMLTPLDLDEALATYRYIIELLLSEKLAIPTAILCQRVPVGKLTSLQRNVLDALGQLPVTSAPMYERDAYSAMKERGMLHLCLAKSKTDPSARLAMRNLETAMSELNVLGAFVQEAMESRNGNPQA